MKAVRLERNDYLFIDMEDPETGPFALEIYRDGQGVLHVKSGQELEARLTGDEHRPVTLVGRSFDVCLNPQTPCPECKGSGEGPIRQHASGIAVICTKCMGTGRRGRAL